MAATCQADMEDSSLPTGVATAGDVEDLERAVKDPFADRVLADFNVTDPLL